MKTVRKTLAKKHFRYLSKKEIEDPMLFLTSFYGSQTSFDFFRNEVAVFLQSALDPRLKIKGVDYSYISQMLIKQVEIAYVFYVRGALKGRLPSLPKVKTVKDRYQLMKFINENKPAYDIAMFFSFMGLNRWRAEIDYLTCTSASELRIYLFEANENGLPIYVYAMKLVDALHQIYKDGALQIELPQYIVPQPDESRTDNGVMDA